MHVFSLGLCSKANVLLFLDHHSHFLVPFVRDFGPLEDSELSEHLRCESVWILYVDFTFNMFVLDLGNYVEVMFLFRWTLRIISISH
jgi:hypothetical protein